MALRRVRAMFCHFLRNETEQLRTIVCKYNLSGDRLGNSFKMILKVFDKSVRFGRQDVD